MQYLRTQGWCQRKVRVVGLISLMIIWLLGGCSGSSSPAPVQEGMFIDSAVEGLDYETRSQRGVTDTNGTFEYVDPEYIHRNN